MDQPRDFVVPDSPAARRQTSRATVRVLVLDMLENSFRNYRVGYAASEAVVLLVIVLVLTLIQFTLLREKGGRA